MSRTWRQFLALISGAALLGFLVWGFAGLEPFGQYPGPYGDILNAHAVSERHVLNVVTAVMFDYRGFDTLGEEFILFASVTGVLLLLRHQDNGQSEDCAPRRSARAPEQGISPDASDATRLCGFGFIGAILVFGIYVVLTGHLSVGGGFQGGVITSAAWLLLFLAYGVDVFEPFSRQSVLEWCEAGGGAAYILIGTSALVMGRPFLTNIFPLGQTGQLFSSGSIFMIDTAVGIEVTAAFVLLLVEFTKPLSQEGPIPEL